MGMVVGMLGMEHLVVHTHSKDFQSQPSPLGNIQELQQYMHHKREGKKDASTNLEDVPRIKK